MADLGDERRVRRIVDQFTDPLPPHLAHAFTSAGVALLRVQRVINDDIESGRISSEHGKALAVEAERAYTASLQLMRRLAADEQRADEYSSSAATQPRFRRAS